MKYIHALIVCLTLAFAMPAAAVQNLSGSKLVDYCAGDNDKLNACLLYLQGYIDGAVATDSRVVQNVADLYERNESFSQRAIRTRIQSRLERLGAPSFAGFCIPDPVDIVAVVKTLHDYVLAHPEAGDMDGGEVVLESLREAYPCEPLDEDVTE